MVNYNNIIVGDMMLVYAIGFIFISLLGALLHFTYDLSNHNKIVGLFSAVNESTWEHIKMALTAVFVWSLVDGFIYGGTPNYFFAKLVSVITIILVIPMIFYGYKTITKRPIIIIDIISFFTAVFISQFFGYIILNSNPMPYMIKYVSVILLIAIFGTYLLVTIYPIKNFIFKDPLTNKYGLKGHK